MTPDGGALEIDIQDSVVGSHQLILTILLQRNCHDKLEDDTCTNSCRRWLEKYS